MKSKKLGRTELLSWLNTTCQSDYIKIESLSDGVGFCQLLDAFFDNLTPDIMKLKMNGKDKSDYFDNFVILGDMMNKIRAKKKIDPNKLVARNFAANFELLQYFYDFIYKQFNTTISRKYKGFQRRVEILKSQQGSKIKKDITKYLPSHLVTNELILQLDKEKYFGIKEEDKKITPNNNNNANLKEDEKDDAEKHEINLEDDNISEAQLNANAELNKKIEKFKSFFKLLEDDLRKFIKTKQALENDNKNIEQENQSYVKKLNNVLDFCEKKKGKTTNDRSKTIIDNVTKIITAVPDEFN